MMISSEEALHIAEKYYFDNGRKTVSQMYETEDTYIVFCRKKWKSSSRWIWY